MNYRRVHLLEKLQVQLAAAGALCVVYFLLAPAVWLQGSLRPLAFLPTGDYAQAAAFAVGLWILAAVCAVATITARPAGAMLAVLIGAGGLSLRSEGIRALLWDRQGELGGLYGELVLEVVMMFVILAAAAAVIGLVRRVAGRLVPGWVWRDPLPEVHTSGDRRHRPLGEAAKRREIIKRYAWSLLLGIALALVLVLLLMRSADRGQILFGLLAGFGVAAAVANYVFPVSGGSIFLVMPMLTAVLFYALAGATYVPDPPQGWINVPLYAHPLPIDWLAAGGAGAVLGYFISARIRQLHGIERHEEEKHAEKKHEVLE